MTKRNSPGGPLDWYFRVISSVSLLTADEEKKLGRRVRQIEEQALEGLRKEARRAGLAANWYEFD